jgi:hypothetical protein
MTVDRRNGFSSFVGGIGQQCFQLSTSTSEIQKIFNYI